MTSKEDVMYDGITAQLNHLHREDLLREAEQIRLVSTVPRNQKPAGGRWLRRRVGSRRLSATVRPA